MRREFADQLFNQMAKNDKIWVVTCDLGFGLWDQIRETYPDRFINVGAAEQAGADIAVGLALGGQVPFLYSITTFLLYRAFETHRTYINYEKIPVKLVGGGRNRDYAHDGISHWSDDAGLILKTLPNIKGYWPDDKSQIPEILTKMVQSNLPDFISLKR